MGRTRLTGQWSHCSNIQTKWSQWVTACFHPWQHGGICCPPSITRCQDVGPTVDTGVTILAVMAAQRLNIGELWFHFGTGRNFRFLAAHDIAKILGPNKCQALSYFNAFAGCDTVPCVWGWGRKTAREPCQSDYGVTVAFCVLSPTPNPTA